MYLYFTTGNGQASQGNQHCANCIGALSFRMNKMPAWQHVDEIKKHESVRAGFSSRPVRGYLV